MHCLQPVLRSSSVARAAPAYHGPLQLPVADCAVMAQSHIGLTGAATSIGEQPLKGLLDPAAMARLALGEALTNLVWARITALHDVKASPRFLLSCAVLLLVARFLCARFCVLGRGALGSGLEPAPGVDRSTCLPAFPTARKHTRPDQRTRGSESPHLSPPSHPPHHP